MAGDPRKRVAAAVDAAEEHTGLQVCVYLGPAGADTRAHAERLFVERGLVARPAVLVLVDPAQHRVEIVTSAAVRERLPDEACASALEEMLEHFRRGRLDDGLVVGVNRLAALAGPGVAPAEDVELPDVLDDSGPENPAS